MAPAETRAEAGDWVRVHVIFLEREARAPGLPDETASHPYEGWINGWAAEPAEIGEPVTIRTPAGRRARGRLVECRPGYHHTFGRPHPAMLAIGLALKRLLGEDPE